MITPVCGSNPLSRSLVDLSGRRRCTVAGLWRSCVLTCWDFYTLSYIFGYSPGTILAFYYALLRDLLMSFDVSGCLDPIRSG